MFIRYSSITLLIFFFEKLVYVGLRHDYKTRQVSKDQLFLPYPQTNLMKKTVLYRGSVAWIMVPINIRKSNCTYVFQRKCAYKYVDVYFKCCYC